MIEVRKTVVTVQPVSGAMGYQVELAMASTFGSGGTLPSRCFAAWTRQPTGTDFDVIGALYSQP